MRFHESWRSHVQRDGARAGRGGVALGLVALLTRRAAATPEERTIHWEGQIPALAAALTAEGAALLGRTVGLGLLTHPVGARTGTG